MTAHLRQHVLEGAPLRYAPANELGVVFLFAHLAKRWQLRVDQIGARFPDCIAYRRTRTGEERVRIEFEYRSRNFSAHKHPAKKCDWLVCWEDNWPSKPKRLQVIELRREFGLGFHVWFQPSNAERYDEVLEQHNRVDWSVPSLAHRGDLILFYMTSPLSGIRHIGVLKEDARRSRAGWRKGMDYRAEICKVVSLKAPVFLEDLQRHRVLRTASFVRARCRWRDNASAYWPYLYQAVVERNASAGKALTKYKPERV